MLTEGDFTMAAATKVESPVLDEVFQNVRKATEATLKMQQEMFSQWSSLWPGLPTPQSAWVDKVRQFRSQWKETIGELARKHGDVIERQYKAATESLDAALNVTDASNPEEFRRRTEQFCRKTLECAREISETQIREFQEMVTKMTDLMTKASP
jgi:hypothetical protein